MRKRVLAFLGVCLLISSACTLPFLTLAAEDGEKSNGLFSGIEEIFEGQPEITPTPTPTPSGRVDEADSALFAGDLENAKLLYQEAYAQTDDVEIQAQALYGLGRSYFDERNFTAAIDAFNRVLGQFPQTKVVANTYFMLAECYEQLEEYGQAAAAYQRYAELKPDVIDDYVYTLQGNAAMLAGDYTQAILAYQNALLADPPANSSVLNIKIGQAYDALEDYNTAIQYYLNVYNTSEDDYSRSTANLLMGQAYQKLDMDNEAYARFLDSVFQFPRAYDSFTALSILVSNGQPVNEFARGLVDYYAGSYDYAIQAFDRYLASDPVDLDPSVYYFKGLSHYFDDEPRQAIESYEILINNYPGNAYWTAAWDEKAYIQWVILGEYTNAAETYKSFVTNAPNSPDAPTFLYEAGRVYERVEDYEAAAQTWLRMMNEYPSAELSYKGLFRAGITYYRSTDFDNALQTFQRVLVLGTMQAEKAKAYFWIGKTYQAQGDDAAAADAFLSGQQVDPTDYYSIRSGEILEGRNLFSLDQGYDLGYDLDYERPEGEAWLRSSFLIPDETDLGGLGELANNARIQRIQAYWELGLFNKAVSEAELLRIKLQGDATNLYRLMNYLLELDLYQPAIYACRDILDLANLDDLSSLSVPIFFTHVRFGAYFREMVVTSANEFGIHPLLFYALIRQESMFNPYISSSAGASGLTQIMPATGKENVDLLGWPQNYETNDLLKGEVSLTLGAFYLSRMKDYLSGNVPAALAAYNAGPGNAETWWVFSQNDPDLFLEVIRFEETQIYLKQIAEFLNIYKLVYTRPQ